MYLKNCKYPFLYDSIIRKFGSVSLFAQKMDFRTSRVYRLLKGKHALGPHEEKRIAELLAGDVEILFSKKGGAKP